MKIAVLGSVNLDLVATAGSLPAPGETVTGAALARHPGGKGANQALAARRLGAEVALFGCVGDDAMAEEALALLRASGADLSGVVRDPDHATGVALIAVSGEGENQIVVCSGANGTVQAPSALSADALILQLEVPVPAIAQAAVAFDGMVVLNLAPAAPVPDALLTRADVIIVNETEAAFYGQALHQARALIALTLGARGAELWRGGERIAASEPPKVQAVDTTGAGDVFVAALTVALSEGQDPQAALRFACAAGAVAATRPGAQPSAPTRAEVNAKMGEAA